MDTNTIWIVVMSIFVGSNLVIMLTSSSSPAKIAAFIGFILCGLSLLGKLGLVTFG